MRAHVVRDVLAGLAVAARARLHEAPALVDDLDARAVELRLDAEAWRLARRAGRRLTRRWNSPSSSAEYALSSDIMRTACLHLRDRRARLAAHALGRRVGRDELRVLLLERAQLAQQRVELGVADDRIVEHVVAVVVRVDLAHELRVPLGGGHRSGP